MFNNVMKTVYASFALGAWVVTMAASAQDVEVVAQFQERPGNPSITPDGRILMTVHPLDHPSTKMVEVINGKEKIYPSEEYSAGKDSIIKAALAVRTDKNGIAWILDLAAKTVIAWDTKDEKLVKTIQIPENVLDPKSFLQDFALDQKRNRIIIADMTQADLASEAHPAFVVVDLDTGKSSRVAESNPALLPVVEGGFALNPITIDPQYEWVYFGALNGHTIYRVPAASFDNEGERVVETIEKYGPKPFSDGISVDSVGNVYITNIEAGAIGVTNKDGYKDIAKLPEGQSWPDGLSFGPDGYVYATINQLDKAAALNNGTEKGKPPFLLIRTKALASGSTGR